jgi:hypothetical protein
MLPPQKSVLSSSAHVGAVGSGGGALGASRTSAPEIRPSAASRVHPSARLMKQVLESVA